MIGLLVLAAQRIGVKLPTYIMRTSASFDAAIATGFVRFGLAMSAGEAAYFSVRAFIESTTAGVLAWVAVSSTVSLVWASRWHTRGQSGRHSRDSDDGLK